MGTEFLGSSPDIRETWYSLIGKASEKRNCFRLFPLLFIKIKTSGVETRYFECQSSDPGSSPGSRETYSGVIGNTLKSLISPVPLSLSKKPWFFD